MQKEDPYRSTPQQSREAAHDRAGQRYAEAERNGQPDQHPERERPADEAQVAVGEQVLRVAGGVRYVLATQHPADMRMPESAQRTSPPRRMIDMRTVRVTGVVGEAVVLAMGGDPLEHRPLDRHRPEHRQQGAHASGWS